MLDCRIAIGFRATPTTNCLESVYRARYYDPIRSRFVSEDPIGLAGGLNTYRYTLNNPLLFVDPHGEYVWFGPLAIKVIGWAVVSAMV